ncbi:MAG: hypothetical protein F8N36_09565 [Desulfovibrio sp.]|uniref:hypothetical protein n=1 Tax=Desulfovibrio sp. TaxID=885 RepID=UPI00135DFC73|nr:hypothetical protein [Desulfovibrio sp.]MTJ93094.1 hypothetical protein [Desulfovibrio sp.]
MSNQNQVQMVAPLGGGDHAAPNLEQAGHAVPNVEQTGHAPEMQPTVQCDDTVLVNQRSADKVLLVETLADFSSDERLVTVEELLAAFVERAAATPPVTVAQVREELESLPDPRFEGPDSQAVAADMARIKAMEKAQPGSAPDPEVPGLRKTRRLLSRRELLTSLLHPAEALAAPEHAVEQVTESVPASGPEQVAAAPRMVEAAYAAALLGELLAENDEVTVFTAWDGKEYYHYRPQMSSLYARILSTGNNRMVQVASVVRDSSRDYPRPVALEIFEYPPFLFEAEALQQCLRDMAENPEYEDIRFTESSVGTVYLYSTLYLDEDYAAFLAENEDVGAIASP